MSIGYVINYHNINFAGAYGYLGKSGVVNEYDHYSVSYPLYERSDSYYWDAALGYQYKSYYFSIAYFKSRKSDNILQDASLGIEYNLLQGQGKMRCKLFGNYHHYRFSEIAVIDDKILLRSEATKEDKIALAAEVTKSYKAGHDMTVISPRGFDSRGFRVQEKDGVGNVLLVGVKLEF
ncbi:hypothetical protein K6025_03760 [Ehrlichia sp. JZT12]